MNRFSGTPKCVARATLLLAAASLILLATACGSGNNNGGGGGGDTGFSNASLTGRYVAAVAGRADPCAAYQRLQGLVTGRLPEELPDLVCGLRQNADGDSDPLKHLCLLWDDPRRLPPGVDEPLVSLGYA